MKLLPSFASLVLLALPVHAAQLLTWNVAGQPGNQSSQTAGSIAADLQTGGALNTLTRVGLTTSSGANSFLSTGWNLTNTFTENNKYITFSLEPDPGFEMTLTSLQYTMTSGGNAPNTSGWGYSIGGGAFVFQPTYAIPGTSTSLVAWDFDDFTTTQTVVFRFWTYGATAVNNMTSTNSGSIRINNGNTSGDDLIVNGSLAAIPEPGALAALGVGLVTLILARRRFVR